ncbi:MAG: C-GCAxxG-C-C family protein [Lachnospiraceae bacterium]
MESRVKQAVELFESGYNCAQSVFAAYADLFGMDRETALKFVSPMGAGIGRMREVCGTVSGMSLLLGLKEGNADASDEEAKKRVYEKTRAMADRFKEENGSIICRELLGISGREQSAIPSERTEKYYAQRPCSRLVAGAAQIVEDMLLSE